MTQTITRKTTACTRCAFHREHRKTGCLFGYHRGALDCVDWMPADLSDMDQSDMLRETADILREIARQLDMEAATHDALSVYYLSRCEALMTETARRVTIAACRARLND